MPDVGSTSIAVPQSLQDVGAQLNAQAAAIADELSALAGQLEPLKSTWKGSAAGYYEGLQNEWNIAAAGLFAPDGVLGQIAYAMGVNWSNYSDAEWANTRTWQS
ncbi:MAG TPA: WXG100 family type VII secretion target [Streptosporangiaceae bacterium]|jgi:WXG100 family type VII secretion target|nr:WXG100 family type VII secretion target [Streptosporangiaceae bacterium]